MLSHNKVILLLFLVFLFKVFGVLFATKIFNYYTPLIDSNLYLTNFFENHGDIRTIIIQKIVIFLKTFIYNDFFIHLSFAILSSIGLVYGILKKLASPIIIFSLFLPSAFVWTSIVGKEAIFFGFFSLIIFIWIRFNSDNICKIDIILLLIAACLCFILRPHYALPLIWLFLSSLIIKKLGQYKNIILFIGFSIFSASCFLIFFSDEVLWRALNMINFEARSSRFEYFNVINPKLVIEKYINVFDRKVPIPNIDLYAVVIKQYKVIISKYWIFSMIGPLPSELTKRIVFIPFFIEGCLVFIFPIIVYIVAIYNKNVCSEKFKLFFYYSILPSLFFILIIHAPFGILNPGSGIRYRVNFESLFYIAPLILYFNCKYINMKH